ncbi:NAD(P)H-hydrate dehydratase [Marinobacter caseinilyticus]|uniref:NAD(P)H-hydrate dehydratase n=1 Tax=Marinobacter caseinilyticus TaxID=2692195 RepID=UPI001409D124|nr:NAD(P)H-hydrate dehydratase [Marinobacter caseinilyticus]
MPLFSATSLTDSLYSADSVRAIDRYVIDKLGIPGFDLMQRAASAAFRQLVKRWPGHQRLLVLCGGGNNGGDGYLVAANAKRHGLDVACVALSSPDKLTGDAATAYRKALTDGVRVSEWISLPQDEQGALFENASLLVDAMLGTGVTGAPREPYATAISGCNHSGLPTIAIDVPSGLDATTGAAAGDVVRAALTVTFIARKAGLYTGQGPEFCGRIEFESLGVAAADTDRSGESPIAGKFDWQDLSAAVPRRPVTAHKGRFGKLLIVAGDRGFGGAGLLAAEAAARTGVGLVSLATRPEHVGPALARCPSVMVHGVTHSSELTPLIDAADTLVCGPGIGRGAWGQQMLQRVVTETKRLVLDADALNLMSLRVPVKSDNHILTPHPGEAARLLGVTVADIEADRMTSAQEVQRLFGGTVLLKGAGTVIAASGQRPMVLAGSNPGMATGGMGDVLSGMIGALLAQGMAPAMAASMAAALHLSAADRASLSKGFMGLLPTDVIDCVPAILGQAEGLVPGGAI